MKLTHSLALCFVSLALAAPHGNGSPGEEAMVVTWADVQKRHGHDVAVDKRAEEAMVVTWADVQKVQASLSRLFRRVPQPIA
ncbi:hypothetical protein MY10362_009602 [Beauveria mimosiformis]